MCWPSRHLLPHERPAAFRLDVLPRIREPMAATQIARPFHRPGWVYEEKYDGWRMGAYKDGTDVKLVNRAGKQHDRRFAELAAAIPGAPGHDRDPRRGSGHLR